MKLDFKHKAILITGVAGFIGSNLAKQPLNIAATAKIIGVDNMNDYYDVSLRESRLAELQGYENFMFVSGSIADKSLVQKIFTDYYCCGKLIL
ncbi:MAG: GDP-mannose 4,6-dehydratase [Ethanoligenens sp.]